MSISKRYSDTFAAAQRCRHGSPLLISPFLPRVLLWLCLRQRKKPSPIAVAMKATMARKKMVSDGPRFEISYWTRHDIARVAHCLRCRWTLAEHWTLHQHTRLNCRR